MELNKRILMIASECAPYAKTGGLADVAGALPKVLRSRGHDVRLVMPKYSAIDYLGHQLKLFRSPLGVWMGNTQEWCSAHIAENEGVPVYFIESNKYFDRWGLYHDADFNDYRDNPRRFGFLARAALQLAQEIGFAPDIVHVHDWQTGLAPGYLKIWHWNDPILGRAASLLTIHNLAHQGAYPAYDYDYLGLQWKNFTPDKFEDHGQINFLKGGIQFADMVNTVSPSYASETRTPEGGHGLAPFLNDKGEKYTGILNGVDYSIWNPALDKKIPARYSPQDRSGKVVCKAELQKRFMLDVNPDVPVVGVISRFAEQKGLHLLAQCMDSLLDTMQVQFVILGAGEKYLESYFSGLPGRFPGRVGSFIGYNDEISHWIEAGSDFFAMPSLFEACGLNQMYSLKYGTLPVVRATGGLEDTIQQYDEATGEGTGFKFNIPTARALEDTIGWAVSTYFDRKSHMEKMISTAMAQDFSWDKSAQRYEWAYDQALFNKPKA